MAGLYRGILHKHLDVEFFSRDGGHTAQPELRHEFVGMMFAVAIGEVGVQTATLVQAHNWVHFLPAYFHLLLATVLIATSWVGWTRSPSPGARADVGSIFEWEFCVLLIDVLLVVVYFIVAKSVDITGGNPIQLNASAAPEAFWIVVVFCIYLVWDILSKVFVYVVKKPGGPWFPVYGVRIVPTVICAGIAYEVKRLVHGADPPHVLTADIALMGLVLLFRALKDLSAAIFAKGQDKRSVRSKRASAIAWSCVFGLLTVMGTLWTHYSWPIPRRITAQIESATVSDIDNSGRSRSF